ncbi:hypothetical protein [Paramicrobacterium chengjingii]|uniref:Uncharacterized protein n=1 Tax=Paramicrobacterium chengjingii TaxID=2769067 RepID=A0ABX6YLY3_9MICO|nr:hypothetical protein [Microbacterium chengjingii]QPZ39710.1 hypothetical protein HCR76_06605 [Microbacterium chengjingii]
MARGVPVDDETRTVILDLARTEVARNEIARRTGVSTAAVSKIVKEAGLSFNRSQTDAANQARQVDLAAIRLKLAEEMGAAALDLLRTRKNEYLVYNFGGKDNDYNEHVLASPPVEVQRSIVVTAGIAFDKASRIVERDTSTGVESAHSLLDSLAAGFAQAAAQHEIPSDAK